MKNKIRITIILAVTIMLAIGYTKVEAVLETRPGVSALVITTASSFFEKIRGMEKIDGAFGLNATFVAEGGTYKETSSSNNIDVHMVKNTEWGIVAMMSASDYGAGNVTWSYNSTTNLYEVTASTTGNMSGVFGMNNGLAGREYVSAGIVENMHTSYVNNIKNAENRYVDKYAYSTDYTDFSRYIPGDATFETMQFTGGGGYFVSSGNPVFARGINGVFYSNGNDGYGHSGGVIYSYNLDGPDDGSVGSRACVWSGVGL